MSLCVSAQNADCRQLQGRGGDTLDYWGTRIKYAICEQPIN